jgi:hypothetical protein
MLMSESNRRSGVKGLVPALQLPSCRLVTAWQVMHSARRAQQGAKHVGPVEVGGDFRKYGPCARVIGFRPACMTRIRRCRTCPSVGRAGAALSEGQGRARPA